MIDQGGQFRPLSPAMPITEMSSYSIPGTLLPGRREALPDCARSSRLVCLISFILIQHCSICHHALAGSQSMDGEWLDQKNSDREVEKFQNHTPSCRKVFLPQNVNVGEGPFQFNIRALMGCEISDSVEITLSYPFVLFVINPDTGIHPGPNFVLLGSGASKGIGMTEVYLKLARLTPGEPGEILATIKADTGIGLPLMGHGAIEWSQFKIDNGSDFSAVVPPVQVSYSAKPARPVLDLPGAITTNSVVAKWFSNSSAENVSQYHLRILGATGEVQSATATALQTSMNVDGLASGTDYTLELAAVNDAGESEPAEVRFTTRFDLSSLQVEALLRALSRDWDPLVEHFGTLQSAVPSPVDLNHDGKVDDCDALAIIHNFLNQ